MSTEKTLADVQPGGRVRLGDQADAAPAHDLETIERVAKAMQASEQKQSGWTWADCSPIAVEGWMDLARAAVAALSAQPSPGGQGDVPSIDYEDLLDQAKDLIHCGCSVNGAFEWLLEQLTDGEALAARQPVNESPMAKMAAALRGKAEAEQAAFDQRVQSCEWGPMPDARTQADFCQRCDGSGWDGESRETKCQSCAGAGIAARQPVGELHLPPDGYYKIMYDDAQVPDESFARTGALDAALRRFEQISERWNAHLFVRFANNTRDCTVPNATPAQDVDLWRPIETAPKNGSSMLLGHFNSAGNWRTMRGRWFSAEKIEMEWENADDFEAGWYEESVEADDIPNVWPTTPTHWQPLPAAPVVDSQAVGK